MAIIAETYTLAEYTDLLRAGKCRHAANTAALPATRASHIDPYWCGLSGLSNPGESATDTTLRLVRDGWKGGVDLLEQVAAEVSVPTPVSVKRRAVWSDYGDDVEMQRVWSGNLDRAWRRMAKPEGQGPRRIRILVDSIASGGENAEMMRWRGVAAMRLADALTESGYSVQMESGFGARGSSDPENHYRLRVIVKAYTDPLDLSTLAATTALPAFFRACHHEWHMIVAPKPVGISYYVERMIPTEFADDDDGAHLFIADQGIRTAAQAKVWVEQCVAFLNGTDEELPLAA